MTGLDDAGMDLQVAQLSSQTDQEVHSRTTLSWADWQLPLFVALCAIAGTILFTFLVSNQLLYHKGHVMIIKNLFSSISKDYI